MADFEEWSDEQLEAFARKQGYLAWRRLPAGLAGFVTQMIFNGRINVATPIGVVDSYCYDSAVDAAWHLIHWDVEASKEPPGWKKHVQSGRYQDRCPNCSDRALHSAGCDACVAGMVPRGTSEAP